MCLLPNELRVAAAAAAALVVAACGSPTEGTPADAVRAVADADSVRVTNGSRLPVFTFVVSRNALPLILWGPCADPAVCPPIPQGGTRAEPRARLLLGPNDREVVVHWWHAVRGADGTPRPDSVRAFVVALPAGQ